MRYREDEIRPFEFGRIIAEKEFRFAISDVAAPIAQPTGTFAPKICGLELFPDIGGRPLRAGLLHDRKRPRGPAQAVRHI